ncbi:hypothetical protein PMAYCL1PPCAC_27159, partial [Pristionchus mayeri]
MQSSQSTASLSQNIHQNENSSQVDSLGDESSISSPCASPAVKKKKFVIAQKEDNERVDEIPDDDDEYTKWETLPWKAKPALDRICFHLRTNEECTDLANFSMVSKTFRQGVMEFMKKKGNQPGLKYISFDVDKDRLLISIHLFHSNLQFHDLTGLDFGRFTRSMIRNSPVLKVHLDGSEDPVIEQITVLMSSCIKSVFLGGYISSTELELCAKVLNMSN